MKRKSLIIPLIVGTAFILVSILLVNAVGTKYRSLTRTLIQWDGQHYLSIAQNGYEMFPCPQSPSYICGNIGWFPFYPLVGRAVAAVGIETPWALLIVSWLSLLGSLVLLYRIVERKFSSTAALGATTALVLFPSSFYFLTGFPYALMLFLSLWIFDMLDRNACSLLWLPTGLIAVTYPSAVVIALPLVWVLLRRWKSSSTGQRVALLGGLAAIPVALSIFGLYFHYEFGDFFLYNKFQGQSYYAHEISFPIVTIWQSLYNRPFGDPVNIMLLFVIVTAALFYRRQLPVSHQLFLFAILLFTPTMGTTDCYYRHIVVAFPLFSLVGLGLTDRWRRWAALAWGIAAIVLGIWVYLENYGAGRLM